MDVAPMKPWSGLLPINVAHACEMGTSELHLNQHHIGNQAPRHAPGRISDEVSDESSTAKTEAWIGNAAMRMLLHAKRRLTGKTPLPKS